MLPPSAKPYLIRAIHEWCLTEGHAPYLLVDITQPGVRAPEGYDKDGKLTLNIAPRAIQNLELGDDRIRFSARFGAKPFQVEVPLRAVVAVFSAETNEGIVFGESSRPAAPLEPEHAVERTTAAKPADSGAGGARTDEVESPQTEAPSHLRLVK